MVKYHKRVLSSFLALAILLTLMPSITVHAEELELLDKVALSEILGQEVEETQVSVSGSVYAVQTSISVEYDIESIALSDFETEDTSAVLSFYGTDPDGTPLGSGESVAMEAGEDTTVYVKVDAADGSVESKYTITISRAKNDDKNSNGIPDNVELDTVMGQTPNITSSGYNAVFSMYFIEASLSVDNTKDSISPNDFVSLDENATLVFFGTNPSGGETTEAVTLEAGRETKVYMRVDAADGSAKGSYTITISRAEQTLKEISHFESLRLLSISGNSDTIEQTLPQTVTGYIYDSSGGGTLEIEIDDWVNTDGLKWDAPKGEYTFTASVTIPEGYSFSGEVTAVVEKLEKNEIIQIYDEDNSDFCLKLISRCFVPDAELDCEILESGNENYSLAENVIGELVDKFTVYDMRVTQNGTPVEDLPYYLDWNGSNPFLYIPTLSDYEAKYITGYKINADGTYEEAQVATTRNFFKFSGSGIYVVAQKKLSSMPNDLNNGTYQIPVEIWKKSSDELSMANDAIADTAEIVVTDTEKRLYLTFSPMEYTTIEGHLEEVWYFDSFEDYETYRSNPIKYSELLKECTYESYYERGGDEYPEVVSLPLSSNEPYIYMTVKVDAMGDTTQDMRLRLHYDYIESISRQYAEGTYEAPLIFSSTFITKKIFGDTCTVEIKDGIIDAYLDVTAPYAENSTKKDYMSEAYYFDADGKGKSANAVSTKTINYIDDSNKAGEILVPEKICLENVTSLAEYFDMRLYCFRVNNESTLYSDMGYDGVECIIDYDNMVRTTAPGMLEDGEYTITASALQESSDEASMTNQFITNPVTLNVEDGEITATMVWEGTDTITMDMIKELKYENSDGEYVETERELDNENNTLTVTFKVEDIDESTMMQVYVPEGMGENRPKFRLVFDSDTLAKVEEEEPDLESEPDKEIEGEDNKAEVTDSLIEGMEDSDVVAVKIGNIVVVVPAKVLNSKLGLAGDGSTLHFEKADIPEDDESNIESELGSKDTLLDAFDLSLQSTSSIGETADIHELGDRIKVTISLTDSQVSNIKNAKSVKLYYYNPDTKELEDMEAAFNLNEKTAVFYTDHLSVYSMVTTKKTSSSGGGSSSGSSSSKTYTIEASAKTGGTINPEGSIKVKRGTDQTFSIKARNGYTIKNVYVNGEAIGAVTTYTFDNVKKNSEISAVFEKIETDTEEELTFNDISGHWAEKYIKIVTEEGIFKGTGDYKFSPNDVVTRGMLVTALGRFHDANTEKYSDSEFTDVAVDSYYFDYIAWAADNGIVNGVGENKFAPDRAISREEAAVIFARYAEFAGLELSEEEETQSEGMEDGQYTITVKALMESKDSESMSNQFIDGPVSLDVRDGKVTVQMTWKGTEYITMDMIEELKHLKGDGEFVEVDRTFDEASNTLTMEFEVDNLSEAAIMQVYAPKGMPGMRPKFRLVFDQTSIEKYSTAYAESSFADGNEISSWAINSIEKMQEAGIISGKDNNMFDPQGTATRAEIAKIFAQLI